MLRPPPDIPDLPCMTWPDLPPCIWPERPIELRSNPDVLPLEDPRYCWDEPWRPYDWPLVPDISPLPDMVELREPRDPPIDVSDVAPDLPPDLKELPLCPEDLPVA